MFQLHVPWEASTDTKESLTKALSSLGCEGSEVFFVNTLSGLQHEHCLRELENKWKTKFLGSLHNRQ